MPEKAPLGAYATETSTGWTAYDALGCTWPVGPEEAQRLETGREARLTARLKGPLT